MGNLDMSMMWLIVIIIGVITEIASMGLTSIWFALAAIVSFILAKIGFGSSVQIIAFIVVTILLLIFTKPFVKKHLKIGDQKTNTDLLIGESAKVTQKINNIEGTGKVFINGMEWTARTENTEVIDEGKIVKVVRIEGVKLIVTLD